MKNILSLIFLFTIVTSCNMGDFGDINVNPNASTTPKPSALLTNAQISLGGTILGTQGALYVQYIANSQYTSADNYSTVEFSWDGYYNGPLADLQKIIDMNSDEETKEIIAGDGSNANQIAIAKILQSYYYLFMTNRWGDLPYSEALKGAEGLVSPKFDSQEEVFEGCIETLKEAVGMMDSGNPVLGDVIFDGDMNMWGKFANTIRLMAAQQLSEINPTFASAEFADAFNDGVIALDNSENIAYRYLNIQAYENPYYTSFVTSGRRDWTIADPLMNMMQRDTYTSPHSATTGVLNVMIDPRLAVFADPVDGTTNYVGMPYGLTESGAGAISNSTVSFLGAEFKRQDSPAYIYTSAQVLFSLAEAVLDGWIPGNADVYYNQGIEMSLAQWGVESDYATYMTNSEVNYDPIRAREQIGNQKWISLFPNGYQAWAEWRRTGFPILQPAANAQTESMEIPRRQGYSPSERDLNSDNYNEALIRQGFIDNLDGRLWWDVN